MDLIKIYHADYGHFGERRTIHLLQQRFFWPGLRAQVKILLKQCLQCICFKTRNVRGAPLQHLEARSPMEVVSVDYLSIEPKGADNPGNV